MNGEPFVLVVVDFLHTIIVNHNVVYILRCSGIFFSESQHGLKFCVALVKYPEPRVLLRLPINLDTATDAQKRQIQLLR